MVSSQTYGRRTLFRYDRWAKLFLDQLFDCRSKGFALHEFVLMPDHFHVLITPAGSLERAVQFIKGGFSYRAKRELGSNMEVWQRGFSDHRIRDAADYAGHVRYIYDNPVKAGLCARPEEWEFSSASGRFEMDAAPQWLKPGNSGGAFGAAVSRAPSKMPLAQIEPQSESTSIVKSASESPREIQNGNTHTSLGPRVLATRHAKAEDVPALFSMLLSSSREQGSESSLCATEENLIENGFGASPRFQVLIAEQDGKAVGMALYFFIYSTWTSRNGLYLEDLYVRPEHRKQGIARELMQELARVAKQNGCGRMIWLVLRGNPAVEFYKKLGAAALEEWMPMQMNPAAIKRLQNAGR